MILRALRLKPAWIPLGGALLILAASSMVMAAVQVALIASGSHAVDWNIFRVAPERFANGTLYDTNEWWYHFRWSPVAAPLLMPIGWMGETAWRVLHVVALVGLPGWVRLIALSSYPFWFDVHAGNVLVFVLVAAFWALRDNRFAIWTTLVLSLLVPRPLMLPLVAWVVFRHRQLLVPYVVLFAVHLLLVAVTGYASEWFAVLTSSTSEIALWANVAPSAWIGLAWMVVAIPAAVVAFGAGLPATSGLLLQPYWLPYYLLLPLADRWTEVPALRALHRR